MSEKCVFINKPTDLGCYKMILKDHFQFCIEGIIEPRSDLESPPVPFEFGENSAYPEEQYRVEAFLTLNEHARPVVSLSSVDNKGPDSTPSIILKSGTHPDQDPSAIVIDVPKLGLGGLNAITRFLLGINVVNPEGHVHVAFNAEIRNERRNYA